MSVKVCVLTQEESDNWRNTGLKPNCLGHRHVNLSTAIRWREHPRFNCIVKAEWAGKNALMVEFEEVPMMWATVYVDKGEMGGPGMAVRQLVRGPALIPGSGATKNGIPAAGARDRRTSVLQTNQAPEKRKHVGVERIDSGGTAGDPSRDDTRLRGAGAATDAR